MPQKLKARGGARIGWINASWPFASLTASSKGLILEIILFGTYYFTPDQVVSLESYGSIPFFGRGVRINHNVPKYPRKVVFWYFKDPDSLIQQIRETGFHPTATAVSVPFSESHQGLPVRWQAIVVIIIVWNILLFLDMGHQGLDSKPGLFSLFAVLFLFLTCIGIKIFRPVQRIFLKKGREMEEIESWIDILILVAGPMLAGVMIWYLISKGII